MKNCQIIFRLLAFVSVILLVMACGQKGPLYLPDSAEQQAKQYDPEENKPVQDKQEKKDKKSE